MHSMTDEGQAVECICIQRHNAIVSAWKFGYCTVQLMDRPAAFSRKLRAHATAFLERRLTMTMTSTSSQAMPLCSCDRSIDPTHTHKKKGYSAVHSDAPPPTTAMMMDDIRLQYAYSQYCCGAASRLMMEEMEEFGYISFYDKNKQPNG